MSACASLHRRDNDSSMPRHAPVAGTAWLLSRWLDGSAPAVCERPLAPCLDDACVVALPLLACLSAWLAASVAARRSWSAVWSGSKVSPHATASVDAAAAVGGPEWGRKHVHKSSLDR